MSNETRQIIYSIEGLTILARGSQEMVNLAANSKKVKRGLDEIGMASRKTKTALEQQSKTVERGKNAMERFAVAAHKGNVDLKTMEANVYAASRGFSLMSQMIVREPVRALRIFTSSAKMAEIGVTRLALASMALKEALAFVIASRFGVIMIMFAAFAALAGGVRGAVNSFKELDAGTKKVMSAMSEAEKATNSYAKTFLTIGLNTIRFGKSAEDVKTILWELNSAGLSASESAAGLETNMRLLYTELDNVSLATRMTSGIFMTFRDELTATRTEAEAFRYIGDVLAYVMNQSIVDADTLLQGYKHVLSTSNAMGMSFAETSATLAILNNEMIFSGMAGRGTRSAFSQLAQDLDDIVEKYGIVVDETKTMGSQISTIFEQLHKKIGKGALSMEDFSFWMKTAGLRGAPTMLALIRNFEEWRELIDTLESPEIEGFLKTVSKTNMDTFNVQWDRFVNSAKVLGGITFAPVGDFLKDIFKDSADVTENLIETTLAVEELNKEYQKMIENSLISKWLKEMEKNADSSYWREFFKNLNSGIMNAEGWGVNLIKAYYEPTARANAEATTFINNLKEIPEIYKKMTDAEKIDFFGGADPARAMRPIHLVLDRLEKGIDVTKGLEALSKNEWVIKFKAEIDIKSIKEETDRIKKSFKAITLLSSPTDYELGFELLKTEGMATLLDYKREWERVNAELKKYKDKIVEMYSSKTVKKKGFTKEEKTELADYQKNVVSLTKYLSSLRKEQEKFSDANKAKLAQDFMLKTGMITEKEHLAILMEQREALHSQMKELYALGGESNKYMIKLGEMRALELEIVGIMKKQTEERGKLAKETAKMNINFTKYGGVIDEKGLKSRISTLNMLKAQTTDPGALLEYNKGLAELYTKFGEMTGTDKFSSNIRPLMMENVALMDEVAKKNEETWKGIEKTLGGFRSLENEVMQPVLDKVKDIATAVAEAGTAITDPGGLTEGFIGVKDLTSGIVFFIEEASGKIKTMKGDLDEISKMDMSNLSGGTEEEPVGRQLKRGD